MILKIPRFVYFTGVGNRALLPDTRLEVDVDSLMSCKLNTFASSNGIFPARYSRGIPHVLKDISDQAKLVMCVPKTSRIVRKTDEPSSNGCFTPVGRNERYVRDGNRNGTPHGPKRDGNGDDANVRDESDIARKTGASRKKPFDQVRLRKDVTGLSLNRIDGQSIGPKGQPTYKKIK